MTDLLGPADAGAVNTLTTTTDVSNPAAGDTWFQDCTANNPATGSNMPSKFMDRLLQQVRRVIRLSGIPLNNSNDDMLGQAIQSGASNWAGAFGGTANALTATLSPAPTTLIPGLTKTFTACGSSNDAKSGQVLNGSKSKRLFSALLCDVPLPSAGAYHRQVSNLRGSTAIRRQSDFRGRFSHHVSLTPRFQHPNAPATGVSIVKHIPRIFLAVASGHEAVQFAIGNNFTGVVEPSGEHRGPDLAVAMSFDIFQPRRVEGNFTGHNPAFLKIRGGDLPPARVWFGEVRRGQSAQPCGELIRWRIFCEENFSFPAFPFGVEVRLYHYRVKHN